MEGEFLVPPMVEFVGTLLSSIHVCRVHYVCIVDTICIKIIISLGFIVVR